MDVSERWYREGLRFGCTRCGNCCRGAGNVWADDGEIAVLAAALQMDEAEFRTVYVRMASSASPAPSASVHPAASSTPPASPAPLAGGSAAAASPRAMVLRQRHDGDCVFFHPERGCTVYHARPRQCRSYPFWSGIVHSPEDWTAESRCCPGIGRGDLHPADEIAATADRDGIPAHRTRLRVGGP